jgi:hypothetical protein
LNTFVYIYEYLNIDNEYDNSYIGAMKRILSLLLLLSFFSCNKGSTEAENQPPANYMAMLKAVQLQIDVPYQYVEMVNNKATGSKGTIQFSLRDTTMTETYNSTITKDRFRLANFMTYSCDFESLGRGRYNNQDSRLINHGRRTLSRVNGQTMISFDSISNGSYYYYQYLINK